MIINVVGALPATPCRCETTNMIELRVFLGVPTRIAGLFVEECIDLQWFLDVAGNAPTTP